MLTQTLRNLEQRGIVIRTITPTTPPAVEYALSPLGTTLIPLMASLRQWAEEHMEEVEQAHQAYEKREARQIIEEKSSGGGYLSIQPTSLYRTPEHECDV